MQGRFDARPLDSESRPADNAQHGQLVGRHRFHANNAVTMARKTYVKERKGTHSRLGASAFQGKGNAVNACGRGSSSTGRATAF